MRITKWMRFVLSAWGRRRYTLRPSAAVFLTAFFLFASQLGVSASQPGVSDLKVMQMGLGAGTITSSPAGINCGTDCDETYGIAESVTLTAAPAAAFVRWEGDCSGTSATCLVPMNEARSVRAVFDLSPAIPTITDFTPGGLRTYLSANPVVNSAARFVNALPAEYKQNWILMSRSESLQTGTAEFPRILLPSANAQFVFSVGLATHSAYPAAHPNAIEYMQWDPADKNFRFHEIVLATIPQMGSVLTRTAGISIDDAKCSKCHSTQNVLNLDRSVDPPVPGPFPGTTGDPVGLVKAKNKPNWDAYDSWGGMMPFNRDRIYQGSVEAAAFRKIFNPWTWRTNASVSAIIEQLELQPPGVLAGDAITRTNGGTNDGHINFAFDASPPVLTEPAPSGPVTSPITYSFNSVAGTPPGTSATRGGLYITLRHSSDITITPSIDINLEGRGVQLFDLLGGFDGNLNQQRIADELINHHFATGGVSIEIRPIALAITKGCLSINTATNQVTSLPLHNIPLSFFDARNGMSINDLVIDTQTRAQSLPLRKANIQKLNLDRTGDVYLFGAENGLIQEYGAATSAGLDISLTRLRQEVFRRPTGSCPGVMCPDSTVMGGIYVDRELYAYNTHRIALYRYFLEPLGVSVDRWSMGVRGRSRTYTFADVFSTYPNVLQPQLEDSLTVNPVSGLSAPFDCPDLITAINNTFAPASLPAVGAVPTFTDIQRIFNKSCIECHGGLGYPPYGAGYLDLSEDENPPTMVPALPNPRLARSYTNASSVATSLYNRITMTSEACPRGMMPCGGPRLSKTDIETIRRWIAGGTPSTLGDPHIKTIDGVNYDFQAAGEFVLLRDEGLEIQARQTAVGTEAALGPNPHTGLTACVSVNSAVAVRIGGQRISYQPNLSGEPDASGLQLRVDGKLLELSAGGIPLEDGGRIIRSTAPGGIQIEAPGGSVVIITPGWWDYYQVWYMNIDASHVRATQGVMGAIAPGSWLPALPDGSGLGPKPAALQQRYEDLYSKFGNAWRVNKATSLFDYAPGTSTNTFTLESWPNGESPQSCTMPPETPGALNKPPVKALTLEVAEQQCREIVGDELRANCVQDVRVTGEPGFAKTYLLTEQIQRNAPPTAPVLVFPEDNALNLARPVTFTWNRASDVNGDSITYRYCVWPVAERPNNNKCNAVSVQATPPDRGIFYALLVGLLGCVLFAVLIFTGKKKKPVILVLVAIAILAAVILAYRFGSSSSVTQRVTQTAVELEPGKAYYWKVLAEDGKGATVESETRRFEIQ